MIAEQYRVRAIPTGRPTPEIARFGPSGMGQRWRSDEPGSWHHVMNRGLARRSVFIDRACARYFLSCLARVVRAGHLEIHAYSILTNHYHLLVRSPHGTLGEAMRLAQNRYVRWFNRRLRRDGPLFRGRFRSRHVESLQYRRLLVSYIDRNAVEAGLARAPEIYAHGSARHYVQPSRPIWLERRWIEAEVAASNGATAFDPQAYPRAFGRSLSSAEQQLVEARLHTTARAADPLDRLMDEAPERVGRWLRRKAFVADGPTSTLPLSSATTVQDEVRRWESQDPGWRLDRGPGDVEVWPPMLVGLLRDLAALRWVEVAHRTARSAAAVKRSYATHADWIENEIDYRRVVGEIGKQCLGR